MTTATRPITTLTHAELVRHAERFAWSKWQPDEVLTEPMTRAGGESPDCLVYLSRTTTVVIECKASRADSLADAGKHHRQVVESGMGNLRYIFAPDDEPVDVPDGWGLIRCDARGAARIVDQASAYQAKHADREWKLLMQAYRNLKRASGGTAQDARPGTVKRLSADQHKEIRDALAWLSPLSVKKLAGRISPGRHKSKTKLINAIKHELEYDLVSAVHGFERDGITHAELMG